MGVSDITIAVVNPGSSRRSKTLGTSIEIALGEMPGVRPVKRGMYASN
jgi:hypothetical protein